MGGASRRTGDVDDDGRWRRRRRRSRSESNLNLNESELVGVAKGDATKTQRMEDARADDVLEGVLPPDGDDSIRGGSTEVVIARVVVKAQAVMGGGSVWSVIQGG